MEENTLLLVTDKQIDWAVQKIDGFIKAKNPIVEAFDGPGTKLVLNVMNRYGSPYIDDIYKEDFQQSLDAVIAGNYPLAIDELVELLSVITESIQGLKPGTKQIIESLLKLIGAAVGSLVHDKE